MAPRPSPRRAGQRRPGRPAHRGRPCSRGAARRHRRECPALSTPRGRARLCRRCRAYQWVAGHGAGRRSAPYVRRLGRPGPPGLGTARGGHAVAAPLQVHRPDAGRGPSARLGAERRRTGARRGERFGPGTRPDRAGHRRDQRLGPDRAPRAPPPGPGGPGGWSGPASGCPACDVHDPWRQARSVRRLGVLRASPEEAGRTTPSGWGGQTGPMERRARVRWRTEGGPTTRAGQPAAVHTEPGVAEPRPHRPGRRRLAGDAVRR